MLTVTVDQVLSCELCEEYTRGRIEELFASRDKVTVSDILGIDISNKDKLCIVLREGVIPAKILHEFACQVSEKVLLKEREVGREPDSRSWSAIKAKRKWLKGELSDKELLAVRIEAREASDVAVGVRGVAADAAAWTATGSAGEVIWVVRAATEAATWTPGSVGEVRAEQIELLKKLLEVK